MYHSHSASEIDVPRYLDIEMLDYANKDQPPGNQTRTKAIGKAEWSRLRPVIEHLYVERGLRLSEVREEVRQWFGFDASEQMYKKRLRAWELRKNYTQEQKRKAIDKVINSHSADRARSPLLINRRPVISKRLWRNVQRDGQPIPMVEGERRWGFKQLCKAKRAKAELDGQIRVAAVTEPEVHRSYISMPPDEQMLWHARSYLSVYASLPGVQPIYGFGRDYCAMLNSIVDGTLLLNSDKMEVQRAFAMINRACSYVHAVLKSQPFQLLRGILAEFLNWKWQGFEHIRKAVVGFIQTLASQVLGPQHPITHVVAYTRTNRVTFEVVLQLHDLELATAEHLRQGCDLESYFKIKMEPIDLLLEEGKLDAAEDLCELVLEETQMLFPRDHATSRHAMLRMADLRLFRKDFPAAEALYLKLVQGALAGCTSLPSPDAAHVRACECLGLLYERLERYQEAQTFWQLAMNEFVVRYIGDEWEVHLGHCLGHLEGVLRQLGKEQELLQLRVDHAGFWKRFERWDLKLMV